ncbi:MAG: hypothetical protein ACRD0V_06275 [Acidimicrobiales bacterium]
MAGYAIIEAPSELGLFPRGVEHLPRALLDAGLAKSVVARHAGVVTPAVPSETGGGRGLTQPDGATRLRA